MDTPVSAPSVAASTLVDLLRWRAQHQPKEPSHTFLLDGESEAAVLNYAELDRRARAIAAGLQDRVAPGARALLLYPPGLEYIAAYLGCLYAGIVAVPAYPPGSSRTLPRLLAIVEDAGATAALTTSRL